MTYMCFLPVYRKHKKLTQTELGFMLGVDKCVISEIETGKRMPELEVREKIAGIVGRKPQEIWPC